MPSEAPEDLQPPPSEDDQNTKKVKFRDNQDDNIDVPPQHKMSFKDKLMADAMSIETEIGSQQAEIEIGVADIQSRRVNGTKVIVFSDRVQSLMALYLKKMVISY